MDATGVASVFAKGLEGVRSLVGTLATPSVVVDGVLRDAQFLLPISARERMGEVIKDRNFYGIRAHQQIAKAPLGSGREQGSA